MISTRYLKSIGAFVAAVWLVTACTSDHPAQFQAAYPVTRQTNVVDDYFGTRVADPYRWLEDDNAAETAAWVEAENKATFAYLDTIPVRAKLRSRLTELWNFARYDAPVRQGGRYFFT